MPTIEIMINKRYEVEITTEELNKLLQHEQTLTEDWRDVEMDLERLANIDPLNCGQTDVSWREMIR